MSPLDAFEAGWHGGAVALCWAAGFLAFAVVTAAAVKLVAVIVKNVGGGL